LLAELPLAGDILPGLPDDLKARLFDAFDIQILWNKTGRQATVHAEITEATLQALPGILNPARDGYDDTAEQNLGDTGMVEDLFEAPIVHPIHRQARINHANPQPVLLLRSVLRVRRLHPGGRAAWRDRPESRASPQAQALPRTTAASDSPHDPHSRSHTLGATMPIGG
jgi:hypothetical protein